MTGEAWLTLGVTQCLFLALVRNAPPDLLFLGATSFLALCGVISPMEAFAGFANPGVMTVGLLFVVAAGLRETGVLDFLGQLILGQVKSEGGVLGRLAYLVLPLSAFLNNTPIVAMLIPILLDWCRRHQIAPSKVLIPLSYMAILGGTCTLIGTSTNLVINGLMLERLAAENLSPAFREGLAGMHLFEISWVGIPYAVLGLIYLFCLGDRLLPERKELLEQLGESRREYLVEMLVKPGCRLIAQTVEGAGLRHLPGLFLIEIDRNGQVVGPVGPDDVIEVDDRLVFTGVVNSIVELEKISGLVPAADPTYEISPEKQQRRRLCEAVISATSPLNGKTVRQANFRRTYGAAVVAVHRNGARVTNKVGDIELRPGDTLLLQTRPHFLQTYRNDPSFYLISDVQEWRPLRRDRAWIAVALLVLLIIMMTTGWVETTIAASSIAFLMVMFGCISIGEARKSVEWQVLVAIASAFGVGSALQNSGAASVIAQALVDLTAMGGPIAALAGVYLLGSVMTEIITNNAAAVLLFPFCVEIARSYQVSPRPFVVALILAASASFMTPIGYQTNMMVYGPGGYRFRDFVRIGLPLNLVLGGVAIILIPIFWPF